MAVHPPTAGPRRTDLRTLRRRAATVLARSAAARARAARCDGHVPAALREELDALAEALRAAPPGPAVLDLLEPVDAERHRLAAAAVARRRDGLLRIRASMARLRDLPSRSAVIDAAPREACLSCGFTRTLLSRISGSTWVPEILSTTGPDSEPDDFRAYLRMAEIPLEHLLLETDMARRGRPALIEDALGDPRTYKGIIVASGAHSYTAAPIIPARRAIGFLHCDRLGQDQPVTEEDRDNLWVFAGQLALVLERAALTERLVDVEAGARRMLDRALADVAGLRDAPHAVGAEPPGLAESQASSAAAAVPTARLLLALTPRERQVLELMATGASNLDIAHALVVSEGTVKTHVKHLLRKLRVDNRSAAVARYLQAVRGRPGLT